MKHLYNSLRTAFQQQGAIAAPFDSNTRPKSNINLEIDIDSLRQQQPPFDVYAAVVSFTFKGDLARTENAGDILRQALFSFREEDDRHGVTVENDNTSEMIILSEPEFSDWICEIDDRSQVSSSSVTVSFFYQ